MDTYLSSASALSLRRDPRMLKLPPYLSLVCILVGAIWLVLLPLDNYSRRTYISENALLPGQVHTYFGGSEHNIFRAYRRELDTLVNESNYDINNHLEVILGTAGKTYNGENVYGILQAPRGDATEAIVLVAAWSSINETFNGNGVALAITLARYFKRWSLWSKDIIILIPPDSRTGTQAWVDAYHDGHDSNNVASLPLKSGALQGAIAIDYAMDQRFDGIHIIYDGTNGQLPNLDLINSIVNIGGGQMGMQTAIQGMQHHNDSYRDRLMTMLRGMLKQGLGICAGPHSSFIPYHVDAVTLQPYGEGWHDEMAMGRVIEGTFRSLNNLLEHLHQSFFFYLLMQRDRFVSIGTYLPSAMLLAANFTIMAIFLWVKSGQPAAQVEMPVVAAFEKPAPAKSTFSKAPGTPPAINSTERDLSLPLGIVAGCHAASVIPLFVLSNVPATFLPSSLAMFCIFSAVLPFIISYLLPVCFTQRTQHFQLTKSLSLLVLGMALATLATLNFSLAFLVGMLASPLTFITPCKNTISKYLVVALLSAVAPPVVVYPATHLAGSSVAEFLQQASFGWNVWAVYTPVVIWCIWWPAWLVAMTNVLSGTSDDAEIFTTEKK
ncbi:rhomboid protein 2 [Metarhizium guizhouense ARSEF 977]|uniref:Rhomboid protein 2 n=1 Tax=Metarhizium guizhouense (strain ARSEF 977) TaxID=1276136 RepID=A0A0B4HAZ2_METGA|nr:rhomboid protein 2 [Metarhizium guizhouense ARSEF 977]